MWKSLLPVIGAPMYRVIKKSKKIVKQMLYNTTIFEDWALLTTYPFDHDVENLIHVLEKCKTYASACTAAYGYQQGKRICDSRKNAWIIRSTAFLSSMWQQEKVPLCRGNRFPIHSRAYL